LNWRAAQATCARANELELFLYNEGLIHIPSSVFRVVQVAKKKETRTIRTQARTLNPQV
jgi:hypothetical protein